MFIDDRFLWNAIENVLPMASQKVKEEIYTILDEKGKWTIREIEKMYAEREKK